MLNRELGELAVPGSATAVSTILFLALAWSGVEAPQALADINIPYQVFTPVTHNSYTACLTFRNLQSGKNPSKDIKKQLLRYRLQIQSRLPSGLVCCEYAQSEAACFAMHFCHLVDLHMPVSWLCCVSVCEAWAVSQATVVRRESSPQAVELARRLKEAGAKMYGAFWCSHCQEQKVSFGAEAQKDLPYVECFPDGYRTVRNPPLPVW